MIWRRWQTWVGLVSMLVAVGVTQASAAPRGKRPPSPVTDPQGTPSSQAGIVSTPRLRSIAPLTQDGIGRPGSMCRPGRDVLTYHGGALVVNPEVFVIFWGPQWQTDSVHINAAASLTSLLQQIGSSTFACTWQEWGGAGMPLGTGSFGGTDFVNSVPAPLTNGELSDATIQQLIQAEITTGNAPPRSDNLIYIVVPPQGVPVNAGGVTGCGGSKRRYFCGTPRLALADIRWEPWGPDRPGGRGREHSSQVSIRRRRLYRDGV